MILHKLILNNVGLFCGRQIFNLTPNNKKPIILIGGMNGVGKTTILDAVRLCLYGRRALGERVSLNEYHEYLSSLIHRSPISDLPLNQATVSLEFESVRDGEKKTYRIERHWKRQRNREIVKEVLTLYENNKLNTKFHTDHWQDYINELIPIGVTNCFFFDGENIQKLVDDSSRDTFIAESVKALFGLNLVERLQSDLRIYANRLVKHSSPESVQKEITEVDLVIKQLQVRHAKTKEDWEDILTQIKTIETDIRQQESKFAAEGGIYAKNIGNLKNQQEQIQSEIEYLENKIRTLCGNLFPFALVPENLKRLRTQFQKELELAEWEEKNNAIRTHNELLLKNFPSEAFWADTSLKSSQISEIQSKVTSLLAEPIDCPKTLRGFKRIRIRNPSEYDSVLEWIDTCLKKIPQEFRELNEALINAKLELYEVENALEKAPTEDVLKPMIEYLSELNKTLGQLQRQERNLNENVRLMEGQLAEAERRRDSLYRSQLQRQAHLQRPKRVEGVQLVLESYSKKLIQEKITILGNAIVDGFNELSHKPNRIKRAEIEPKTFAVTLFDTHNKSIIIEELSAGEKQIYATALLWGLAKTSGRALPMIIDTPLGRLDTNHRQLLVEHYFPYVSHQVILLSTDTEVTDDLLSLLKPYISQALHLVYQQSEGKTTIKKGYFK